MQLQPITIADISKEEDANIYNLLYRECVLIVKALNKHEYNFHAARELGISERNLYAKKSFFNIEKINDVWVSNWSFVMEKELTPLTEEEKQSGIKPVTIIKIFPVIGRLGEANTKDKAKAATSIA